MKKTSKNLISGTSERPRVCVFRSNTEIYAQAIDDTKGATLCAASSKELKGKNVKVEAASTTGEKLAEKLKANKIESIVFDRNIYQYQGRVKALAEGMRKGGIKF